MAISFAGGTDGIVYGNIQNAGPTIGCCAFRMKTTQTTTNAAPVTAWNGANSRDGFGFIINNTANKMVVVAYDGASQNVNLLSATSINDGNWHTVGYNWNGNNGGANALFIDGASEATGNSLASWTLGPGPPSGYAPPRLGAQPTFWASYVGELAEVAMWNRQLDAAEQAAFAKGFSAGRIATNALTFHAPLIRPARNRFEQTLAVTGTTVTDHPRTVYPVF